MILMLVSPVCFERGCRPLLENRSCCLHMHEMNTRQRVCRSCTRPPLSPLLSSFPSLPIGPVVAASCGPRHVHSFSLFRLQPAQPRTVCVSSLEKETAAGMPIQSLPAPFPLDSAQCSATNRASTQTGSAPSWCTHTHTSVEAQ